MILLTLGLFAIWIVVEVPIVMVAAGILGDGEFETIESIFNKHFAG